MKTVVALALAFLALIYGFYAWQEHHAHRMAAAHHLPDSATNGLKHAYAAAGIYRDLRWLQFSPLTAGNMVDRLGVLNEQIEQIVRTPKDSTLEMMKDMHNNCVGRVAARWLETHSGERETTLVALHDAKLLFTEKEEVPLPVTDKAAADTTRDVMAAHRWQVQEQSALRLKIETALGKTNAR